MSGTTGRSLIAALVTAVFGIAVTPTYAEAPVAHAAPPTDSSAQTVIADRLADGQRLLTHGSYDEAIVVLQEAVQASREVPTSLGHAYLLLVKAYVLAGNYYRFRAKGAVTSELYYQKAEELILECLLNEELRQTTPEPPEQYPPEMLAAFQSVRADHFGSLRLIGLDPPTATLLLDDAIVPHEEGVLPELRNLATGPHRIIVQADGYEDWEEPIDIAAGATLERGYVLKKRKGVRWWATRIGGAVAAGTVVAVVASSGGGSSSSPLPGPPDPPE